MAFVKDDDVIQALLPDRADHALDVSVLPRGAWCRDDLSNSHRLYPFAEDRAVRSIAVAQQKAIRSCLPRERFNYLLRKPRCRGMLRNIEPLNGQLCLELATGGHACLPHRSTTRTAERAP